MKVAIYCRVSTEEQNVDTQEDICKEYCNRQGWEVFEVYKDIISGAKESRPSFNQLLSDMRSLKFNCIMVTKLDRLGRSLQHLLSLIDEFNRKHAWDTAMFDEVMNDLLTQGDITVKKNQSGEEFLAYKL